MSIVVSDLSERLDTLTKLVLAEPVARIGHSRVTVRPLTLRGKAFFQLEYQQGQKVAHRNVARGALLETFEQELDGLFRSVTLCTETETRQYVRKTNGAYKCTAKSGAARAAVTASHNRKKEYILQEGENIPALVDLGVFTPDFKIVKAKYDKYKQINRFIELVDDAFRAYGRDEITILDFGCGKSYLTFAMYYYFRELKKLDVNIIGLDLKEDVIAICNGLAEKYGYEKLHFYQGDIASYTGRDEVDMVVTLHACDTATDYALEKAVKWNAKVILSVPCCQHELNRQIANKELYPIMDYGILKERMAALLTDGIRAKLLENAGYETQILEFIDMEHTPKNLLIRAVKRQEGSKKLPEELKVTAESEDGEVMAVEHTKYPIYGVQFHPESVMTPDGKIMIELSLIHI